MSTVSIYDARPFFEKALQFGASQGILNQSKLDAICAEAPKGMVQIAAYFGSEFLQAELERARERIVNLVSLFLEVQSGGDLTRAAEWLRDHTFLSCSKGGSTMLKELIGMPQTSHFGLNERQGFTDEHIPQLAKWSLRSITDYRTELDRRERASQVMDAAVWLAGKLRMSEADLDDAGADAEAVIRTGLLALAAQRSTMPNWVVFEKLAAAVRTATGAGKASLQIPMPPGLPAEHAGVIEAVRQSVLADVPKIQQATVSIRKLFNQSPAFMGRYFWIEDALSEVDQHDRSASLAWKKVTAGQTDEGALLTLFLCVATGSTPKTMLTERTAATLVRKIRKGGLDPELALQYIHEHAPLQHQEDYAELWSSFVDEARPVLASDSDYELKDALALLRRECVVKSSA